MGAIHPKITSTLAAVAKQLLDIPDPDKTAAAVYPPPADSTKAIGNPEVESISGYHHECVPSHRHCLTSTWYSRSFEPDLTGKSLVHGLQYSIITIEQQHILIGRN